MAEYRIAPDIDGTFPDAVVLSRAGTVVTRKARHAPEAMATPISDCLIGQIQRSVAYQPD